jgi:hypothetical protein
VLLSPSNIRVPQALLPVLRKSGSRPDLF